eukprot:tig00021726_g23262.t1
MRALPASVRRLELVTDAEATEWFSRLHYLGGCLRITAGYHRGKGRRAWLPQACREAEIDALEMNDDGGPGGADSDEEMMDEVEGASVRSALEDIAALRCDRLRVPRSHYASSPPAASLARASELFLKQPHLPSSSPSGAFAATRTLLLDGVDLRPATLRALCSALERGAPRLQELRLEGRPWRATGGRTQPTRRSWTSCAQPPPSGPTPTTRTRLGAASGAGSPRAPRRGRAALRALLRLYAALAASPRLLRDVRLALPGPGALLHRSGDFAAYQRAHELYLRAQSTFSPQRLAAEGEEGAVGAAAAELRRLVEAQGAPSEDRHKRGKEQPSSAPTSSACAPPPSPPFIPLLPPSPPLQPPPRDRRPHPHPPCS